MSRSLKDFSSFTLALIPTWLLMFTLFLGHLFNSKRFRFLFYGSILASRYQNDEDQSIQKFPKYIEHQD